MKRKIYLSVAFFMAVLISRAQVKQGEILLGGNVGFNTQKTSPPSPTNSYDTKATNVTLNPSFGIAVKENLLEGFDLTYLSSQYNYSLGNTASPDQYFSSRSHSYGAGFFVRKYKPLGSGFYIFLQGRLGGSYNETKTEYVNLTGPGTDSKGYTLSLGFYPGISYAISKRVQLETGFQNLVYAQYSHSKETDLAQPGATPFTFKTNAYSLNTSLSNSLLGFVVGVRVLLGGS